ncbi:MAG: hypothetical protein QNK36_20290 [Colwellia sp.]|nr:hypothetical protein [Colwellia sp.]
MKDKIHFIKPTVDKDKTPILNKNRQTENTINGIETSIMIDTNVLIRIESVVKNGNTLRQVKQKNLNKLLDVLNNKYCIQSVSAGLAQMEMPPANREYAHYCFNEFTRVHASSLSDDHRGLNDAPESSDLIAWGFDELDKEYQSVYSFFYGSFLLLLIANQQALSPEKKYKYYISRVVKEFDLISSSISEIAKLCFYSPTTTEGVDFKNLLTATKGNFLAKPKKYYGQKLTPENKLKVSAFNSATDLFFIQSATYSDAKGFEGTKQDTWIATADGKLASFIKYFAYSYLGKDTGMLAEIERYPEQVDSPYWKEVDHYSRALSAERAPAVFTPKNSIDIESFLSAIKRIHTEIKDIQ